MTIYETYQQRMDQAAAAGDREAIMQIYLEAFADPDITVGEHLNLFRSFLRLRRQIQKGGAPA